MSCASAASGSEPLALLDRCRRLADLQASCLQAYARRAGCGCCRGPPHPVDAPKRHRRLPADGGNNGRRYPARGPAHHPWTTLGPDLRGLASGLRLTRRNFGISAKFISAMASSFLMGRRCILRLPRASPSHAWALAKKWPQRGRASRRIDAPDECPVDLQLAEPEAWKIAKRRIASPEIVERCWREDVVTQIVGGIYYQPVSASARSPFPHERVVSGAEWSSSPNRSSRRRRRSIASERKLGASLIYIFEFTQPSCFDYPTLLIAQVIDCQRIATRTTSCHRASTHAQRPRPETN